MIDPMTDPHLAEDVACPTCFAPAGKRCRNQTMGLERQPHANRRIAYREAHPASTGSGTNSEGVGVYLTLDVLRASRKALEVAVMDVSPENAEALSALLAALPEPPAPPSLRERLYTVIVEHWEDPTMPEHWEEPPRDGMIDAILDVVIEEIETQPVVPNCGDRKDGDGCYVKEERAAMLAHLREERAR